MKKNLLLILIALVVTNVLAQDFLYKVKPNETLTEILYAQHLKPVYGKNGSLENALKLNPQLKQENGNKIFPKMKLVLTRNTSKQDKMAVVNEEKPSTPEKISDKAVTKVEPESDSQESQKPEERLPSNGIDQSFYWSVSPSISWKELSSTDENAFRRSKITALSNASYGLSFLYGMRFSEELSIYSRLFLESTSFIEDNSIYLAKKNFLLTDFALGGRYKENWQLEAGMSDQLFLTSPTYNKVEIKKVTLPKLKGAYQKNFYEYHEAKLSALGSASAFIPRSAPGIDSSFSYGFSAEIEGKLRNQSFTLGYEVNLLKATSNSTNSQNIFWKYRWEMQ